MENILLVRPEYDLTTLDAAKRYPFMRKRSFMAPLDLATVSALTPEDVHVDMWDEGLHGRVEDSPVLNQDYDFVGITGYGCHFQRARKLGQLVRARGIVVGVGGPGVSASPERYRDVFDILFIGEAEQTWPAFIHDWDSGHHRHEYRQLSKVDMANSPIPRWNDLAVDLKHYLAAAIQTTRGCPFDCSFCDVIYIFGRRQRHKSIDQVLEEVATLERLDVKNVFFCDDNFYGNPRFYKELLRELVPLNASFDYPLLFSTQIDIRIARDEEMLELLADSNFASLCIGIESPNVDSLVEVNARKNLKADLVGDVKRIQSYGMEVNGSMIVGFDHDDTTIFDRTFEFLHQASIPVPQITPLQAMVGTKLWTQLLKDGRVVERIPIEGAPDGGEPLFTNVVPKSMAREELLSGWSDLIERVRDWRSFEERVKDMISGVTRKPHVSESTRRFSRKQKLGLFGFILFSMDSQARGTTLRLMQYTRRRAPWMMTRVLMMILKNFTIKAKQRSWREAVALEVSRSANHERFLRPVQVAFLVPDAFRKPYMAVFPELHNRVFRGLVDKSRADDVLVEVVYDFLTRWGPSFERFEDQHLEFLHEIGDRSIAKANVNTEAQAASSAVDYEAKSTPGEKVPDIRRARLAEEVLRAVEQELRSFQWTTDPVDPAVSLPGA